MVEDEEHFLLFCKNNETVRNILFYDIAKENPDFIYYCNLDKLVSRLNLLQKTLILYITVILTN